MTRNAFYGIMQCRDSNVLVISPEPVAMGLRFEEPFGMEACLPAACGRVSWKAWNGKGVKGT